MQRQQKMADKPQWCQARHIPRRLSPLGLFLLAANIQNGGRVTGRMTISCGEGISGEAGRGLPEKRRTSQRKAMRILGAVAKGSQGQEAGRQTSHCKATVILGTAAKGRD